MGIAASYFVEARLCALFGSLAAFRYLGSHYDIASAGPDCKNHFVVRIVLSASNPDCWILHIEYSYVWYCLIILGLITHVVFFCRSNPGLLFGSAREFHVSLLSCLTTESYWILLFSSIESLLSSPNSVVNFPLYTVDCSFSMFHISLMFCSFEQEYHIILMYMVHLCFFLALNISFLMFCWSVIVESAVFLQVQRAAGRQDCRERLDALDDQARRYGTLSLR